MRKRKILIALYIFFILWGDSFLKRSRDCKNSQGIILGSSNGILVGYYSQYFAIHNSYPLDSCSVKKAGKLFSSDSCYLLLLS